MLIIVNCHSLLNRFCCKLCQLNSMISKPTTLLMALHGCDISTNRMSASTNDTKDNRHPASLSVRRKKAADISSEGGGL